MAAIPMKTTGALDKSTVLSLNHTDRQCVKDRQTLQQGIQTSAARESRPVRQPSQPVQQPSRPTLANMPVPRLQNTVQKGQKIQLPVTNTDVLEACFGWNTTDGRCDLDVSAFLLGADGKVLGDSWFVFTDRHKALIKAQSLLRKALAAVKPYGSVWAGWIQGYSGLFLC